MRIISTLLTAFAGFALAVGSIPVHAQQQAQQPQRPQVVNQFDDTMVRYLLADIQANYQVEQASDGSYVYRASAEGDMNFTLAPRACTPEAGCLGLMMIAIFTGLQVSNSAQFETMLHNFNDRNPTAKLIRGPNGIVALQAYMNSAYGISYRNAQSQLLVFGQNIVKTSQALAAFEQQQAGG